MYCRKEMVKILKCELIPEKSYDTLSKGAIFFGQPCRYIFKLSNCWFGIAVGSERQNFAKRGHVSWEASLTGNKWAGRTQKQGRR